MCKKPELSTEELYILAGFIENFMDSPDKALDENYENLTTQAKEDLERFTVNYYEDNITITKYLNSDCEEALWRYTCYEVSLPSRDWKSSDFIEDFDFEALQILAKLCDPDPYGCTNFGEIYTYLTEKAHFLIQKEKEEERENG